MHQPPHPGTVLEQYLEGVSVSHAAASAGVSRVHLSRILHGKANISADMALRLAALLGTSAELWLGMQSSYDLWLASQTPRPAIARLQWA
jgi:addiction module HigA family antidote